VRSWFFNLLSIVIDIMVFVFLSCGNIGQEDRERVLLLKKMVSTALAETQRYFCLL
jgi:hypothetical protein